MTWLISCVHAFQLDVGVIDVPKAMAWCEDSLCVGFKRDYYLIKVGQSLVSLL